MNDCINLTDMGKELVAETLALGCTANKACDVNKFDNSRGNFLGVVHFSKLIKTLVGNRNNTYIGLDSAERVVCRLSTGVGDSVKKGGLTYVRQSNDT